MYQTDNLNTAEAGSKRHVKKVKKIVKIQQSQDQSDGLKTAEPLKKYHPDERPLFL